MSVVSFSRDKFFSYLTTKCVGHVLRVFDEVGSTQDVSMEHLKKDTTTNAAGSIFLAETQTIGRGTKGRSFISTHVSNLWVTFLWWDRGITSMSSLPYTPFKLTSVAPFAVMQACKDVGVVDAKVKWPNDVWVKDKKVAGMLIDTVVPPFEKGFSTRLGIGINVNASPSSDSGLTHIATCLKDCSPSRQCIDREYLLSRVCFHVEKGLYEMEPEEVVSALRMNSVLIGRRVRVHSHLGAVDDTVYKAQAVDINRDGFLQVKRDDGSLQLLSSEDVSVRPQETEDR
jgi:BirA family transcriptional regulator, biotin operon repressor / biotin---[acetyl-CoA-carboxylase] ligase